MDLYDKSIKTLELPAVLEMLKAEAVSEAAKNRAADLRPSSDPIEVAESLSETTEAKRMISLKGNPPFSAIREVAGSLMRARMGGMLNTRELLDIALVLRCARTAAAYGTGHAAGAVDRLFCSLKANKYLEDKISLSIIGEDEIADSASSELASIRRHIRAANARVRDVLQKIITSTSHQKSLQEPIITMRGDRYVIPVKAEYRNSIPGLVHDISSSGGTIFVEPMQVVSANNEIKELQAKEKREIERILMELSDEAASFEESIMADFGILVKLDLIFAKAKLSYLQKGSEAELSDSNKISLRRARHPLLDREKAVPVDITLGDGCDTMIITGPNTGGKTVTLKTLGLLCLMTQCGLHIPADYGSCMPVFGKILADIGDEQSIEQSLSTFSSHMTNIVSILAEADERSLILFDELGAGTDPVEGAALAVSIIEYARSAGAMLAATTHYAELKLYATTTPSVINASCEFNVETLRPTYRLIMGIPGKSNAFEISRRLGLSEEIIADAAGRIDSGNTSLEEVLELLQKERQEMERRNEEARIALLKAKDDSRKAEEIRKSLEAEKEKAALIARREADRIIAQARKTSEEVFAEISQMRKRDVSEENIRKLNDARADIMKKLNEAEQTYGLTEEPGEEPESPARDIKAGDTVEIKRLGSRAEVISVAADGSLTLQAGIMKITAKPSEVKLIEGITNQIKKFAEKTEAALRSISVSPEIDLRGMSGEEAVLIAERYIDSAVMSKLNTVTIIHGKGTGALRNAVSAMLRKSPHVKSFRLGHFGEGETGVTVVELKQ